jgi:hypothetical protein
MVPPARSGVLFPTDILASLDNKCGWTFSSLGRSIDDLSSQVPIAGTIDPGHWRAVAAKKALMPSAFSVRFPAQ